LPGRKVQQLKGKAIERKPPRLDPRQKQKRKIFQYKKFWLTEGTLEFVRLWNDRRNKIGKGKKCLYIEQKLRVEEREIYHVK